MQENNQNLDSINENSGNQHSSDSQQDLTAQQKENNATQEDIDEANKPQPNVILNKADASTNATSYRDNERVSPRANEASDRNDTNTGGMISGGAKGTSQS